MRQLQRRSLLVLGLLGMLLLGITPAAAGQRALPREDAAFVALWNRTDGSHGGAVSWIWGARQSGWWQMQEAYQEGPGGLRWVRYYDKARMEVTDPTLAPASQWFVTNGLLVVDLVTGQLQIGNAAYAAACATPPCGAQQAVAGDSSPANPAPTYRDFAGLIQPGGVSLVGQAVDQWLVHSEMAASMVLGDPTLAQRYPETSGLYYDELSQKTVPQVFWQYITSQPLEPLYLFGHPISAAYWTHTLVGGVEKDVLVQLFERRTLTYTPSNDPAWQIEMGNVGQHYYAWRYAPPGLMPWQSNVAYQVPILTYHYISVNPNPADSLRTQLSVTPSDFAAQLEYLAASGYASITLDELLAAQAGALTLPPKPVLLTFDDGYADFYQNAYPLLQRYQIKATIYIPTDLIDRPGYMSWDNLRELAAAPLITVGAHSLSHPALDTLGWEAQREQISASKTTLESQLGIPIRHFCYPYGRYNATTLSLVAAAGYTSATTTRTNLADQTAMPLVIPRVAISGSDGRSGFVAKLSAAAP
jgi:peptidoglycan/xylan/chitin deacetylase (PgdA/CDA1 family)